MHRRRWLVAVSTLAVPMLLADPAQADVGFFPRSNLNIRVRFDNLDEYPGFDFYLKYGLGTGNPAASMHLTRVYPATTTPLEGKGDRITDVYLVAIPRGQSIAPPGHNYADWLNKPAIDMLQSAPLPGTQPGSRLGWYDGYLIFYRVRIEGVFLEVTCVGSEAPRGWLWTLLGGLGLGLATAAVVLVRRRRSGRVAQV